VELYFILSLEVNASSSASQLEKTESNWAFGCLTSVCEAWKMKSAVSQASLLAAGSSEK
jgi:hypothetical protein